MDVSNVLVVDNINALFDIYPWLQWLIVACIGLIFGSFAGCVAYRLPVMLEHYWESAAHDFFELPVAESSISLLRPRSFCPHCEKVIALPLLLPVFGYFLSRGRCNKCQKKISTVYPALEIATAVLFCWIYAIFGLTIHALLVAVLGFCMLILVVIDARNHLLPDVIVLPLLWLGLLVNWFSMFIDFDFSFWGAVVGYSFFWGLYWILFILTGREAMGRGDIKLLAMLGAWCGIWSLPSIVFFASCAGLLWLLLRRVLGRGAIDEPLAFGPFLVGAGLISLLYGLDWFFDASLLAEAWQQLS